ncbi:MAG: hypothetical protein ACOC9S_07125 [Planctomycetota bacterium]
MRSSALTLICIAAVSLPALAQSDSSNQRQEYRYVARIKGDNVNIRSRPDVRYGYRCAQASAPQTVRVVRELEGWVEILPTDDCFSVVSADYVKREDGDDIGTITGDRVRIRAGGERRTRSFNVTQGHLNSDDQVRILGELSDHMGKWYKIEPPLGAYWYISDDYVERASGRGESSPGPSAADRRSQSRGQPPSGQTPADSSPTTTRTADDADADDRSDEHAEKQAAEQFAAAEEDLKEEFKKPLPERDLTGLLERYQSIETPEDSTLKSYIDARVAHIRHAIARQEAYHSAKRLAEQTAERQRQHELRLARIQAETPSVEEVTAYDAEGVLLPSEIFTGGANAPKRFTLRDTLSRRINAYVQSSGGAVDLSQYVGKKVGVFGRKKYDTDLRLHVVEAEKVVVLSDDPRVLQPSRPTVIPRARLSPAQPPEPETPEEVEQPTDEPEATEQPVQPVEQEAAESDTDEEETGQIVQPEDEDDDEEEEPDARQSEDTEQDTQPAEDEPTEDEPVEDESSAEEEDSPSAESEPSGELPETGLEMVTPQTRPNGGEQPVPEEEYD